MLRIRLLTIALTAVCSVACAAPDVGVSEELIVNGDLGGIDSVVLLQNYRSGGLCTGSFIAERVVLTAKHCVQRPFDEGPARPQDIVVGVGDSVRNVTHVLRPQSITTTPGVYTETRQGGLDRSLIGSDVAVIVLQNGVPGIEPLPLRRETHTTLRGQTITAVGYGQTPAGRSGVKYTTTGVVTGTDTDLIYVGAITCQGDSGGPAITEDGEVAGVVSFGAGDCGTGYGAYNAIENYFDLIDAALLEAGSCLNDGEERCDGADNDCDDLVDETCTALGESCGADSECLGTLCAETSEGRICTAGCDPLRPDFGCGPGLYCQRQEGCEGLCVPTGGTEAGLAVDADCTRDAECSTLYCADPGDGRQRCLPPCRGDEGMCLAGEACAVAAGACGGCVDASIVIGDRGLGETCAADTDCRSETCQDDDGRLYCTRACEEDPDCPDNFHCRDGFCAPGPRGEIGEFCVGNDDCAEDAFCAQRAEQEWCTRICMGDECPEGFDCVEAGGTTICAPILGLLGDACTDDAMCISGNCTSDGTTAGLCTRLCSNDVPCGGGLECRRDGENSLCARPEPAEEESGGCSVGAGRRPSAGWLWIGALGLLFARRRSRAV
ncbi:MAG: trypsin-like serine protease [Sandaracinaceae bacterium]